MPMIKRGARSPSYMPSQEEGRAGDAWENVSISAQARTQGGGLSVLLWDVLLAS